MQRTSDIWATDLVDWIWPLLEDRSGAVQRRVLAQLVVRSLIAEKGVSREDGYAALKLMVELLAVGLK